MSTAKLLIFYFGHLKKAIIKNHLNPLDNQIIYKIFLEAVISSVLLYSS